MWLPSRIQPGSEEHPLENAKNVASTSPSGCRARGLVATHPRPHTSCADPSAGHGPAGGRTAAPDQPALYIFDIRTLHVLMCTCIRILEGCRKAARAQAARAVDHTRVPPRCGAPKRARARRPLRSRRDHARVYPRCFQRHRLPRRPPHTASSLRFHRRQGAGQGCDGVAAQVHRPRAGAVLARGVS